MSVRIYKQCRNVLLTTSLLLILSACTVEDEGIDGNPAFVTEDRWLDEGGRPIVGATAQVQLDKIYSAQTDANGVFELKTPQSYSYPEVFAGSVSKSGYLPKPIFFKMKNDKITFTFVEKSRVTTDADVVFDNGIGVVHLGDDNFSGASNSQLQLKSSGQYWAGKFTLTAAQKSKYKTLCVSFSARGVDSISNNDMVIVSSGDQSESKIMPNSNYDGTYSRISLCYDISKYAKKSVINVHIISNDADKNGDYDDFEFTNVIGLLVQ